MKHPPILVGCSGPVSRPAEHSNMYIKINKLRVVFALNVA
jgi:hypothetical protein